MNVPDFPDSVPEFNKIVKYRFYSKDKLELYHLGNGIASVNTLKYKDYFSFEKQIKTFLDEHKKTTGLKQINRIGLRYINKISLKDKFDKVFKTKFELPDYLSKKETGFNYRSIGRFNNRVLVTAIFSQPFSKKTINLDMNCYLEEKIPHSIPQLIKWTNNSYKIIKKAFTETLTNDFIKKIAVKI